MLRVLTASQRRAAGEREFCDCLNCVINARGELTSTASSYFGMCERDGIGALLRALVIQTLLDPATYARPAGWRP